MSRTKTLNDNGEWVEATPIPYYPNIFEKIWSFIKRILRGADDERS